jgi:uncharacterized protein (DUF2062 family)
MALESLSKSKPNRAGTAFFSRRGLLRTIVRGRRFIIHNVLKADDPPHRLALGIGIALFVTFTPTIGVQSALVILLAWMFGANKLVGLPVVWISNPATFVPIYYPCYRLGRWILGGEPVSMRWWRELGHPPPGSGAAVRFYWTRLLEIIEPLTVGCLFVAIPIAGFGYVMTYQAVVKYRELRARRNATLAARRLADCALHDAAEADRAGNTPDGTS